MRIRVKLFAIIKERAGVGEIDLELPAGADVGAAASAMKERFPAVSCFLDRCAFAVNQAYTAKDTVLNDGDDLAVIPPVSGG